MERIVNIRKAERQSHEEIYANAVLFDEGTWLSKPVKTVIELLPFFEKYESLRVLDLGSGVGRNCIPIAQKYCGIDCKIDCVDILETAIEGLNQYSAKYNVRSQIHGIVMPLEDYRIARNSYDLIMAISSLEHVKSIEDFWKMLREIAEGVCAGGVVCLIMNSNVVEVNQESGGQIDAQFEVNMPTNELLEGLKAVFNGWYIVKHTVVHQEYEIPREKKVDLSTEVVTWVAEKPYIEDFETAMENNLS